MRMTRSKSAMAGLAVMVVAMTLVLLIPSGMNAFLVVAPDVVMWLPNMIG